MALDQTFAYNVILLVLYVVEVQVHAHIAMKDFIYIWKLADLFAQILYFLPMILQENVFSVRYIA
jgi:hypothetical protein